MQNKKVDISKSNTSVSFPTVKKIDWKFRALPSRVTSLKKEFEAGSSFKNSKSSFSL